MDKIYREIFFVNFRTLREISQSTDAHIYLNANSHPEHLIKNIPKYQFLHLCHLFSDTPDYLTQINKCNTVFYSMTIKYIRLDTIRYIISKNIRKSCYNLLD